MNRWGLVVGAGFGSALSLILAAEINDAASWANQPEPKPASAPDMAAQDVVTARVSPSKGPSAKTILARPLFNWNRRPGQSATAADGPLPRLTGIVTSDTDRYAIFAAQPGGKPQVVKEGNAIGRFKVDAIGVDGVILKNGAESQTLRPSFDVPPPPPMATPDAS